MQEPVWKDRGTHTGVDRFAMLRIQFEFSAGLDLYQEQTPSVPRSLWSSFQVEHWIVVSQSSFMPLHLRGKACVAPNEYGLPTSRCVGLIPTLRMHRSDLTLGNNRLEGYPITDNTKRNVDLPLFTRAYCRSEGNTIDSPGLRILDPSSCSRVRMPLTT